MAKKNDIGLVLVVGLLILGGIYIGMTSLTPKSVGTPGPTTTTPSESLACSNAVDFPWIHLSVYYNDTSTVPPTPVKVDLPYTLYHAGDPIPIDTRVAVDTPAVNCGYDYIVFFGDNSNYYLTAVPVHVTQLEQLVQVQMKPISAPTVQFNNGTIAGYANQAKLFNVPNGYTETNLQMRISAGSGFWGNPDFAVMFAYNSSQIQSIKLNLPTVSVPSSAVSIPAGFATVAYLLPAISNYQQVTLNPVIVTRTLPSNTAIASPINVYLISQASYNQNGNLVTGLFTNPVTQAPLVTPVSSVATNDGTGGILIYG